MNGGFGVFPAQQARARISLLQLRGIFIELARVGGAEQRIVDDGDVLDAAHGALEEETFALGEASGPAALDLVGQRVEPSGDVACGRVSGLDITDDFGAQHARDRRLLDHLSVIAAVQVVQHVADDPGVLHHRLQVAPAAILAGRQLEDAVREAGFDQVVFQSALVFQVLLGFAAGDLVERRLRDVEVAALNQRRHLAEEERQQQRADMRTVNVGVGHQDDLVIAQFGKVEIVAADAGAQCRDQRADLLGAQHLVEARPLDIEYLAAQRQDRLEFAVAAHLGATAGGIALDDEQFGLGGIALLAVGELAG